MDFTTITAAYEGLKTSKQILGAIFDAKVDAEAQPKVIAALEQLGNAQDALFALREELFKLQTENDALRRQLSEAQSWVVRSSQYNLVQTDGGAVVYKFNADPKHFACPSCFNKQQLQILQDNRTISGEFRCTGCNSEFPVNPYKNLPPLFARTDYDPYSSL